MCLSDLEVQRRIIGLVRSVFEVGHAALLMMPTLKLQAYFDFSYTQSTVKERCGPTLGLLNFFDYPVAKQILFPFPRKPF